jgi:PAS domain S-box-containing protein
MTGQLKEPETVFADPASQAEVRRRDKILKAVYLATERFLRMHPSENSIEPLLEKLGQAAEVDRVYIAENRPEAKGKLVARQRFEWSSTEVPLPGNSRLHEISWNSSAFRRWRGILNRNQILSGVTRQFPSRERDRLLPLGVQSLVVAPIFVGKQWWGIIGFDEVFCEREWSALEIEALKTAANIIGAAVQHQNAENALLASEEQYRLVVEHAKEGIVITQDGRLKLVNRMASEISGYTKDELMNTPFLEFVHPEDCEVVWQHHVKRLSGEEIPEIYHFRLVTRGGEIRWLENNGVIIEWNGRLATLNFLMDITARESALEALRESEKKIHWLTHELIKAQESERHRIARYLHDQIAQDLSSLKIACDTVFDGDPPVSEDVRQRVSQFSKNLQLSINTVRNLAYDLRPAGIDQLGLVKTIYKYCDDFNLRTGIEVDFYSAGVEDLVLDFDTRINLFRLIQEGLNNINKHAAVNQAKVRLVASSPNIILRIEDNGKGFDVNSRQNHPPEEKRMGLSSMEERVGLLGGIMGVTSAPGRGCKILIEVPIGEISNG